MLGGRADLLYSVTEWDDLRIKCNEGEQLVTRSSREGRHAKK